MIVKRRKEMRAMRKVLIGFAGILFLFNAISVASLIVGILIAVCLISLVIYLVM